MSFIWKSTKLILHGSPIIGLTKINAKTSRFKNMFFGTYDFQRALRYCASIENGGNIVVKKEDALFILNTNPRKLVSESGCIYILNSKGFISEPSHHEIWKCIKETPSKVVASIKITGILQFWFLNKIYAVDKKIHPIF